MMRKSLYAISSKSAVLPGVADIRSATLHAGFLEKEGGQQVIAKDWQPRWCVLTYNCLYYFRSRSSSSAAGMIPFSGCTVQLCTSPDILSQREHVFELVVPSGRIYRFDSFHLSDLHIWVNLLTEYVRDSNIGPSPSELVLHSGASDPSLSSPLSSSASSLPSSSPLD